MPRNAASTRQREANTPAGGAETSAAGDPVDAAEALLGRYLQPGRWGTEAATARFLRSDDLGPVIAAYERGMAAHPTEPALPWNLASSLDRLGLADLALAYVQRAIRVASAVADEELADAASHLAWADIALKAGQPEVALVAIAAARALDPDLPVERYVRRVQRSDRSISHSDRPSALDDRAVVQLVAASCTIASGGELNASTSLVDDDDADLVFHRRGSSVTLAVQVKSRSWAASAMPPSARFTADVGLVGRPRRRSYALFVAVDERAGDYGPVWLVPSVTLEGRVRRFVASAHPASRDQWTPFRLERSELPRRLVEVLGELEGVAA